MNKMLLTTLAVCALGLVWIGHSCGGWSTELGRVYFAYAFYVLCDVGRRIAVERS
jgi:hypothetical protein